MKKILLTIVLLILITLPASGQTLCTDCPEPGSYWCEYDQDACDACWETCLEQRPPVRAGRRVGPNKPPERPDYQRQVGVNIQFVSTQCAPSPWWHITCEYPGAVGSAVAAEHVATEFDLSAIAMFLDEHPWDESQNWSDVCPLFQSQLIDVVMIQPLYWGVTGLVCGDEYREVIPGGNGMSEYPTDDVAEWCPEFDQACRDRHQNVFEGLYKTYGDYDIDIIVTSSESDWDIYGTGCRSVDECDMWPGYWALSACENDTWARGDHIPTDADCYTQACYQLRHEKVQWMIKRLTERQRAAERARARHPDAKLRVWHNVEVAFFGTREWQYITVLKDVLPFVPEVDSISMSLYGMSGGPARAIMYVEAHTGLPRDRIFISEVGYRAHGGQYGRIYDWVNTAFEMGVRLAFVWNLEYNSDAYNSDWTVVDRETWEWFPGMQAIHDLNEKWRNR